MKSVKEIEKETGINKQKIYREIRKNGLKPQKKINGINYFSDDVLMFFNAKSETENEKVKYENCNNNSVSSDFKLIQELKQEVKQLRNQIDRKDEQIMTLSRLLDQQQKLSLADKKQIENHSKKDNEISKTVSKETAKKTSISVNKEKHSFKSFFNKFIKK